MCYLFTWYVVFSPFFGGGRVGAWVGGCLEKHSFYLGQDPGVKKQMFSGRKSFSFLENAVEVGQRRLCMLSDIAENLILLTGNSLH